VSELGYAWRSERIGQHRPILPGSTSCPSLPHFSREQTAEPIFTGASVGWPIPYTIMDVRDNSWLRFSYRRAPWRRQKTLRIRVEASRGSMHASWSRSALPTHRRNCPGRNRPSGSTIELLRQPNERLVEGLFRAQPQRPQHTASGATMAIMATQAPRLRGRRCAQRTVS
jgi:hypothetical protein